MPSRGDLGGSSPWPALSGFERAQVLPVTNPTGPLHPEVFHA